MNFLNFILSDVKKYSEIVSKVVNIDVEIMDSSFVRIAGTGNLEEKVGLSMRKESHIYHQVLKTKKTIIFFILFKANKPYNTNDFILINNRS